MKEIVEKKYILYPLCLISTSLINLLLSICGAGIYWNNSILVTVISNMCYSLVGIVFCVGFLFDIKNRVEIKIITLIGLLFCLPYLIFFVKNGLDEVVVKQFIKYIVFCIPVVFATASIIIRKEWDRFIKLFWIYNLIVLPFELIYIVRFSIGDEIDNTRRNFGLLNYMNIAYLLLILFIFVAIDVFVIKRKHHRFIKCVLLLVDWLAIVYSGTRGAIICCFIFAVLLVLYQIFINKNVLKNKSIFLLIGIVVVYLFSVLVWAPTSSAPNWRFDNFVHELNEDNENINSSWQKEEFMEFIVNNNATLEDSIKEISKKENIAKEKIEEYVNNRVLYSRMDLYKIAFMEFEKQPLLGNGALAFKEKYNGYPHNIILEIMADYGVMGLLCFVILIAFVFYKMREVIKNNLYIAGICLFSITIGASHMVSGTIYLSTYLNFVFSFAIFLIFSKGNCACVDVRS